MSPHRGGEDLEQSQDYLITVGDLMAGLIFLFILTLLIFAFRFQTAAEAMQSATETRTKILIELKDRLDEEGISVTIDTLQGVLRLSDTEANIGFEFAREWIVPDDLPRVAVLTRVLSQVVPCFAASGDMPCDMPDLDQRRYASRIHALQIEGHTDTIAFAEESTSRFTGNLELSAARAAHVYERIIEFEPRMTSLLNPELTPILGVAGYGAERRLPNLSGDDPRQRRIDLRFIMEPPRRQRPAPVDETERLIQAQSEG
jgi:chemotaxis protein MotB